MSSSNPSHHGSTNYGEKEVGRFLRARQVWWLKTPVSSYTGLMSIWTQRACDNTNQRALVPSRLGSNTERELDTGPIPNQAAICSCYSLAKWNTVFCNGVSLSISIPVVIPRQISYPGAVGQHKTNSMLFLWTFCFVLPCFCILVLLLFWRGVVWFFGWEFLLAILFLDFVCLVLFMKDIYSWVHRKVGRFWEELDKGKHITKLYTVWETNGRKLSTALCFIKLSS